MASELSEKTLVKLPLPLAITIAAGLIGFGGTYFSIKNVIVENEILRQEVKDLKEIISINERNNRAAREEIKDDAKANHDKLEARFMDWLEKEIGGLRSDWERDKDTQEDEIDDLNRKVFGK